MSIRFGSFTLTTDYRRLLDLLKKLGATVEQGGKGWLVSAPGMKPLDLVGGRKQAPDILLRWSRAFIVKKQLDEHAGKVTIETGPNEDITATGVVLLEHGRHEEALLQREAEEARAREAENARLAREEQARIAREKHERRMRKAEERRRRQETEAERSRLDDIERQYKREVAEAQHKAKTVRLDLLTNDELADMLLALNYELERRRK